MATAAITWRRAALRRASLLVLATALVPSSSTASDLSTVNAGASHACAVTRAGEVRCWGSNLSGQLGEGRTEFGIPLPTTAIGLTDVAGVSLGDNHSCALSTSNELSCWGRNDEGQIGVGLGQPFTNTSVPVPVPGLGPVSDVATGTAHTCAVVAASGGVFCWGINRALGIGIFGGATPTPVQVLGLDSGFVAVAAGGGHACALDGFGEVMCWGSNGSGQLGNGSLASTSVAVAVTGLADDVIDIAAGLAHTCAILVDRTVQCWGSNGDFQLGNETETHSRVPVSVTGLTDVASISLGHDQTCAVTQLGAALCWGAAALGDGTTNPSGTPVPVLGPAAGFRAIGAGGGHTCAEHKNGRLVCFGDNQRGELGIGSVRERALPHRVDSLSDVHGVALGFYHSCSVTAAGAVDCWGANFDGALGGGTSELTRPLPGRVAGFDSGGDVLSSGLRHTCVLTSTGGVECWGANSSGQLGDGSFVDQDVPIPVAGLATGVAEISAGHAHTCAVMDDGTAYCWGNNTKNQLGDGTETGSGTPVQVFGLTTAVEIGAGGSHTCALTSAEAMFCWGDDGLGQLGIAGSARRAIPTAIPELSSDVWQIAVGGNHSCAVLTDGDVLCWGYNAAGQLGVGDQFNKFAPTLVTGLSAPAVSMAAGNDHTCAVLETGGLDCWGFNNRGQIGTGDVGPPQLVPAPVSGLGASVTTVSAGQTHTCAVTTGGILKCWGRADSNLLGDGGYLESSAVPVPEPSAKLLALVALSTLLGLTDLVVCHYSAHGHAARRE